MTHWDKVLRSLGFTESEANIYLISLEMGPSPVQDLARKAGVSRMTTYTAIESLTRRSLMSSVEKGKKTLYAAENPERLVTFVEHKIREAETTLNEVQQAIQELKLKQRGEKPVVKLFEGPEALKAIESDMLDSQPKHMDEFVNADEINRLYPREQRSDFVKKIEKLEHIDRAIVLSSSPLTVRAAKKGATVVQLDPNRYKFYGDIFVYDDKIALSTFRGKQISVLIESKDIAETFRALFDFAFEQHRKNQQ